MGRPDWPRLWALFAAALLVAHAGEACAALVAADVVLKGGTVVDGTGAPGGGPTSRSRGDRIVAVGTFAVDPEAKVIDASAWIVAPGFIDLHTHSDDGIARAADPAQPQLPDAGRDHDRHRQLRRRGARRRQVPRRRSTPTGPGTNVIHLIPHGAVRVGGHGQRRPAAEPRPSWSG